MNEPVRVRLIYEKRGGACFVPHVSLATLFTRSALRAGLSLALTQGFSPHPRMSFGPELPAGVAALREPMDIWVNMSMDSLSAEDLLDRWNAALPEGFRLLEALFPGNDAPALGKVCQAALYWARSREDLTCPELLHWAQIHYGDSLLQAQGGLDINEDGRFDWISLVVAAPAQKGIGGWVKAMTAEGATAGWQDLNIVRAAIGAWDGARISL